MQKGKSSFRFLKKPIKKILVPLDGSKNSFRALSEAINLAKFTNAKIISVYVIPIDIGTISLPKLLMPLSTIREAGYLKKQIQYAKKILKAAEIRCKKNKISFSGKILKGNPGLYIIRLANNKKNKINRIVIASRGITHPQEILFGSVSYYVVHKAKIPVLVVK